MLLVKDGLKNHKKDKLALMEKWAYANNLEYLRFQIFNGNVNRLNVWFSAFVLDPQSVVFNLAFVFVSFFVLSCGFEEIQMKMQN